MDCVSKITYKMCKYRVRKITTDMLVISVNKQGELRNSQPCINCAKILIKQKKINIRNLYFSNNKGEIECHDFKSWYKTATHMATSGWRSRYNKKK